MSTPRISLITTVRNGERFLPHLVESVKAQSLEDFEWIVVDDGSSDCTPDLLEEARKIDVRLRVFSNPFPGRGRALRLAIEVSQSPYIAICDADDLSYPWRLAWQWEDMEARKDAAAIGYLWGAEDVHTFDESTPLNLQIQSDRMMARQPHCHSNRQFFYASPLFKRGMPFGHSACVMRRDAIMAVGDYDAERIGQYDYSLFIRMAAAGMNIYVSECSVGMRFESPHQSFENGTRRYRMAALRCQLEALRTIPGPSLPHIPYLMRTAAPLLMPNTLTSRLRRRSRGRGARQRS